MAMSSTLLVVALHALILSLSFFSKTCYGTSSDVQCLKDLKQSIQDPKGNLRWSFVNMSTESNCNFNGVECWMSEKIMVVSLRLFNMGLVGQFPLGLEGCTSLSILDLSGNNLTGPIPSDIFKMLPYLVTLNLSFNGFSGPIPDDLSNCIYLNFLALEHNSFNGSIPWQMSRLARLTTLNVADNSLSGRIPSFVSNISSVKLQGNPGLCGEPLDACPSPSARSRIGTIVGLAIGVFVAVFAVVVAVAAVIYFLPHKKSIKNSEERVVEERNKRTLNKESGRQVAKASKLKHPVLKMKLEDLIKATGEISSENIIRVDGAGTTYMATLPDGSVLAVKRLQSPGYSEIHFLSEMATLGSIRHRNLLPVLGYCIDKEDRMLVYKYMRNGSLRDHLHQGEAGKFMEWPLRLKISIGVARGLAWLHHCCNPCILHRNLNPRCILLDDECEAKISDFGLARLMDPMDSHLSIFDGGHLDDDSGYVAPEYSSTLVATPRGNVYSFGMVLLEVVTHEKPAAQPSRAPCGFNGNLVEWVTLLSRNSRLEEAIDVGLIGNGHDTEIVEVLKVACSCVLPAPKNRLTMLEVYRLLQAVGERYPFAAEADDDVVLHASTMNPPGTECFNEVNVSW